MAKDGSDRITFDLIGSEAVTGFFFFSFPFFSFFPLFLFTLRKGGGMCENE